MTLTLDDNVVTVCLMISLKGSSSDRQLTGGAIAGIVIACVVVLTILLIVLIGWYHYRNIHRYRLQET